MYGNIVSDSEEYAKPLNILRGVLGVASGWDTPPSNLSNITDGNITTVTGTGQKTTSGAADAGIITFDTGQSEPFLIGLLLGYWTSTGTLSVTIEGNSDNGSTWSLITNTSTTYTNELIRTLLMWCPYRYFRIRFSEGGAATSNVKLYSCAAYKMGI